MSDENEAEYNEEQRERDHINWSARLSLHEFLLEIILANDFARHPDPHGDFAQFREQLLFLLQFKMTVRDDAPDYLSLQFQEELVRLANKFFDGTSKRITSIREILDRIPPN